MAALAQNELEAAPIKHAEVNDWPTLKTCVRDCQRCSLAETRIQSVFGVGDEQADWMIIGEAPGADEDRQGEPFVGRAGRLLDEMLLAVGQPRKQVFIANMVKCRPPSNRDPQPDELAACRSYLQQQIAHIKPSLILTLGRIAAQQLLQTDTPIGKLRGKVHQHDDFSCPIFVTYHPAYLLRSPRAKRQAWLDLNGILDHLALAQAEAG